MTQTTRHFAFRKMHGLGNDFVIFDARLHPLEMTAARAHYVASRTHGVGCDQLIVLRQSRKADVFMEIWNADGSFVNACGNATRCVGHLICSEKSVSECVIETAAGFLAAEKINDLIRITMGQAGLAARQIPLAKEMDTSAVDLDIYGLPAGVCVSMGNPHIVFFLDTVPDDDFVQKMGAKVENHSLFPQRVNVSFATVMDAGTLRLKVWERGVGMTAACGTAACATAVAGFGRGITSRRSSILMDGGSLTIDYHADGTVLMTGPVAYVFEGEIPFND